MPTPVFPRPQAFQLGGLAVGNPVSAAHGFRSCEDLAWLLACAVEDVADCPIEYDTGATTPLECTVFYCRSPGVSCLLVGVELNDADSATATVTVTEDGSALTWVHASNLDGSGTLACPAANTGRRPYHVGVVDVSGFAADGTVYRLEFNYARTSAADGLRRVFVREIPQSAVDPAGAPTTEVSAAANWPYPRRNQPDGLVDGSASTAYGFVRLEDQCESARTNVRVHRQWCTYEDDTRAAQTASAVIGALTWNTSWTGGDDPLFVLRARRMYGTTAGTAVAETATPVIRYKCGGTGGTVRFVINGSNVDRTVAAAAAWTTLALSDVDLPTDQTAQRVELRVQGGVDTVGTLRLATWALITNE